MPPESILTIISPAFPISYALARQPDMRHDLTALSEDL